MDARHSGASLRRAGGRAVDGRVGDGCELRYEVEDVGVALLQLTGFSINQLSIVGFVIALGLLVDDSIVVVENIARFLRRGMSRDEAAVAATRQIAVAVVGCTATLIAAFIPMFDSVYDTLTVCPGIATCGTSTSVTTRSAGGASASDTG